MAWWAFVIATSDHHLRTLPILFTAAGEQEPNNQAKKQAEANEMSALVTLGSQ